MVTAKKGVRRAPRTKVADTEIAASSEPKRWRIPLQPVDDRDLSEDERWIRRFDRRMSALARDKHPLSWRDIVVSQLERGAPGALTGESGPPTKEAVLALTLRIQEWIVTSPSDMGSVAARRALKAIHRVVCGMDGLRNEVLGVLSGAAMEEDDDRVPFVRPNLRRLLGEKEAMVTDDMILAAVKGWPLASPGEAPRAKWKAVVALLHALGFKEATDATVSRRWRAFAKTRKTTPAT